MALGHVTTGSNHITVGVGVEGMEGMVVVVVVVELVTLIQPATLALLVPRIGGTSAAATLPTTSLHYSIFSLFG